jgi:phospholipid-binding lipoprotein MlaA
MVTEINNNGDRRPARSLSIWLAATATTLMLASALLVAPAFCAGNEVASGSTMNASAPAGPPPDQANGGQPYGDPLAPFNDAMFTFNLKLDKYVILPVAKGWAAIAPVPVRHSVSNFMDNVGIIPRFANNLFQLRLVQASDEVMRFGINTTLGIGGLFDVADSWFGLKENPDDFGLTLGHYGVPSGPYLVLPFFGPSTIRDTVGKFADGAMNPLDYLTPWYVYIPANVGKYAIQGVNYRSLHLNLFEEVDRYAIDLYGSVQDAYMQRRAADLKQVNETSLF